MFFYSEKRRKVFNSYYLPKKLPSSQYSFLVLSPQFIKTLYYIQHYIISMFIIAFLCKYLNCFSSGQSLSIYKMG